MSEADEELWRRLTAGIAPLRSTRPPSRRPDRPAGAEVTTLSLPRGVPLPADAAPNPGPRPPAPPSRPAPPSGLAVGSRGRGVDDRRWRALAAERVTAARTLDLHGHTLEAAFRALAGFLRDASADEVRVVEIVTGHGRLTGGGAIRHELAHWLNRPELRPLVVAVRPASRRNDGAVRLLLTRRRSPHPAR